MKRLMIAVLVLMAWASLAYGQTVGQDGQSTRQVQAGQLGAGIVDADSTIRVFRMSSTGGFKTSDEARDRDSWTYFSRIYSDTISNAGKVIDSTGVIQVSSYGSGALLIHPIVHGLAGQYLRIAIQIRGHFQASQDSSSTFPITGWSVSSGTGSGAAPALRDSIGQLPSCVGSAVLPWCTEQVIVLQPDVDRAQVAGGSGAQPKGFVINIPPTWAPYISVRFRNITLAAATPSPFLRARLDVTYVGTPLR